MDIAYYASRGQPYTIRRRFNQPNGTDRHGHRRMTYSFHWTEDEARTAADSIRRDLQAERIAQEALATAKAAP